MVRDGDSIKEGDENGEGGNKGFNLGETEMTVDGGFEF